MRILGVDPGLGVTGYGLLEATCHYDVRVVEAGVIRTRSGDRIGDRLRKIYDLLGGLIKEHKPDVLVLEKIYSHYKHPATAILMGHARGVICLLCGIYGVQLVNYPPSRIKKAITGSGRASKDQIQRIITEMLKLKKMPEPQEVSDAIALAM